MNSKRILLINLSFEKIYEKTNASGIAPMTPPLSLACIGGSLLDRGHDTRIFDFNIYKDGDREFKAELVNFKPNFVGITFVTPLIKEADRVMKIIRKYLPEAVIICGGPHCSSFPESALRETHADVAVIGEGDVTTADIIDGKPLSEIRGIGYKKMGKIIINPERRFIHDLDQLPVPAHQLYHIHLYKTPSAIARYNPVAWLETSRGCIHNCIYCNKSCFGSNFRVKSPARVTNEFIRVKNLGFREIHLTDDGFTTDIDRVKNMCDMLVEKGVDIPWTPITGTRVDKVDLEMFQKMKLAGCYRVYYGIESGNQKILNGIKKGITLEQVRKAVELSKKAGLEVAGLFMIGLPGETEQTMEDTINFARELDLDMAKIALTIPLPGTELFGRLDSQGLIKTRNWEEFKFYSVPSTIYNHENLSWKTIEKYYYRFYRRVYLRPSFILRRLKHSIAGGTLIDDMRLALSVLRF